MSYDAYARVLGKGMGIVDGSESTSRQLLLTLMAMSEKLGNRRVADALLVDATRWLRIYPYDAVIWEAREQLRAAFPPLH